MSFDVCPRCRAAKTDSEQPNQYGPCGRCAVALRTTAAAKAIEHAERHAAKAADSHFRACAVCGHLTIIDTNDPYAGRRCDLCGTDFAGAAA